MATKWQGEGWYTVRVWDNEGDNWECPEAPEAHYFEREDDFEEFAQVPEWCEAVVTYYGDDLLPDEPVRLDEEGGDMIRRVDNMTGQHGRELYGAAESGRTWLDEEEAEELGIEPGNFDYAAWREEYELRYYEALEDLNPAFGRSHAGFRALRESLGLSQADVAHACGVQERTIRRWETPDNYLAPDDAWAYLARMRRTFESGITAALDQVFAITREAGKPPRTVSLTYYRNQAQYDELGRDAGPVGFRNAMTREVAARLAENGQPVKIAFVDE